MSLETTTLIGILTLLAICLGVSFLWTVAIETWSFLHYALNPKI